MGSSNTGTYDFALARYNLDGSLDPTFGTDGRVTTDFAGDDEEAKASLTKPSLRGCTRIQIHSRLSAVGI